MCSLGVSSLHHNSVETAAKITVGLLEAKIPIEDFVQQLPPLQRVPQLFLNAVWDRSDVVRVSFKGLQNPARKHVPLAFCAGKQCCFVKATAWPLKM